MASEIRTRVEWIRFLTLAAMGAMVVALGGCSQVRSWVKGDGEIDVETSAGYPAPKGVKLITDIPYRDGNDAWMVDIAMPTEPSDSPRPAVLAVHGGGWSSGDKNGQRVLINELARHGYVGVGVRYRLTGEAPFPACIEDVKCAVRWLRAHGSDYNVDPNRVGAVGHSAGAHLVAMLGVAGKEAGLDAGPWQEQSSVVNAVCGIATPTDFLTMGRGRSSRFGSDEEARQYSPITYVNAAAPPFLLIQGTRDGTVNPQQPKSFADALREAGAGNVNLVLLDDLGHDPMPSHEAILRPMILSFFDTTIGPRAGVLNDQVEMEAEWRAARTTDDRWTMDKFSVFDVDGDGKVSLHEFPGADEMFARVDRSFNGYIDEPDFAVREGQGGGARQAPPAPQAQQ